MNELTDRAQKLQQATTEEMQVAGAELMARIKALLAEGRVRHIKVKSSTGQTYFEVPLGVGMLGGAALAWATPFLAMAGALAGLVSSVHLEVARDGDASVAEEARAAADTAWKTMTAAKRSAGRAAGQPKKAAKGAVTAVKRAAAKTPARLTTAVKRAAPKVARATAKPAARGKKKTTGRR